MSLKNEPARCIQLVGHLYDGRKNGFLKTVIQRVGHVYRTHRTHAAQAKCTWQEDRFSRPFRHAKKKRKNGLTGPATVAFWTGPTTVARGTGR